MDGADENVSEMARDPTWEACRPPTAKRHARLQAVQCMDKVMARAMDVP